MGDSFETVGRNLDSSTSWSFLRHVSSVGLAVAWHTEGDAVASYWLKDKADVDFNIRARDQGLIYGFLLEECLAHTTYRRAHGACCQANERANLLEMGHTTALGPPDPTLNANKCTYIPYTCHANSTGSSSIVF